MIKSRAWSRIRHGSGALASNGCARLGHRDLFANERNNYAVVITSYVNGDGSITDTEVAVLDIDV